MHFPWWILAQVLCNLWDQNTTAFSIVNRFQLDFSVATSVDKLPEYQPLGKWYLQEFQQPAADALFSLTCILGQSFPD